MTRISRRSFIKKSLAIAGATIAIGGTKSTGRVLGANETIRVAVAGLNGRGSSHVDGFGKQANVQIAYLVDPDTRTFSKRLKQMADLNIGKAETAQDIRKVLEDKSVDAVSIATPNHWHSLMTIWACQANKDVYVEKPCSHNIFEGRIAVEAARKYNRIVQHGTQSRSEGNWRNIFAVIESGKLGKLQVARGLCYKHKGRGPFAEKKNTDSPKDLDFNIWLGPAPDQPYNDNYVHYNWHWFWDFGNGDIGNQGVHQMDIARWGIKGATYPKSVICIGGRFGYKDAAQVPNTQVAILDYGETQLIFEVRGLESQKYYGDDIGNTFHTTEGTIANGKFYKKGSDKPEDLPKVEVKDTRGPGKGHFANFIEAVRSRKTADLNADILEGHYSSALCHLANISYRVGEEVPFQSKSKPFGDNKDANEAMERMEEHLAKGHALKLDGMKYRLGRKLSFDAKKERFVDNADANKLVTRDYRKGFVVPEKV